MITLHLTAALARVFRVGHGIVGRHLRWNISSDHPVGLFVEIDRQLRRTILGSAALATWLIAGDIGVAQLRTWTATHGDVRVICPLTIGGSFEAKTTSLTGTLSVDPVATALTGELSVDLKTLDTGISLRNRHMLDNYLEVQKGGDFSTARLSNIDVGALTSGSNINGQAPFTARLHLHGRTHAVAGNAKLSMHGGSVRVEASFPVRISDYGIADPRHLGVGVKNEVTVRVVFLAGTAPTDANRLHDGT